MGTTSRSELSNSIVEKAVNSIGKGFDLTSDFRLKYCKGKERLVLLNGGDERTMVVPGFASIHGVSPDIKCDKGDRVRYQSDILTFTQMSEVFNRKVSMPGKIPSGLFNAMFGFRSGSWASDAADVKRLGMDGSFISLLNVHIDPYPLVLSEKVRHAVPSSWDPSALARFIEEYGTHIIVGLSVGGQDVVLVKQDKSSNLEPSELKEHLDDLGDQIFSGTCNFTPMMARAKETKRKTPKAFNVFENQPCSIGTFASMNTHDGISVICSKRGGDPSVSSHCEWLQTVPSMPDVLNFSFVPITSLLKGVPGDGLLAHAINLYLRYKPPIADLQYFLDFQIHKVWAPIYNDLPLGPTTNRSTSSPAIHFNRMGPKLYVNTNQVMVGQRPVTGMRFYLEGMKCNKLAIHLQHPINCPKMMENKISQESIWRGSEELDEHDKYLEAINGKNFSHVCTVPLIDEPEWSFKKNDAFIVTGAQLVVKKRSSKTVLHLRLLFSRVKDSFVVQSCWTDIGSELSQRSGIFSAISMSLSSSTTNSSGTNSSSNKLVKGKQPDLILDSAVFPTGPPVSQSTQKLLRFVDTSQYCKGPQDNPGHWLVTGARLYLDKGRLGLNVNFSLLNVSS